MNKLTYGRLCELAEKYGVTITENVRAFVREVEQTDAAQPATEPIAWESTTPFYRKYLTQSGYERIGERFRKWYKPYRCSACTNHEASALGLSEETQRLIEAGADCIFEVMMLEQNFLDSPPSPESQWDSNADQLAHKLRMLLSRARAEQLIDALRALTHRGVLNQRASFEAIERARSNDVTRDADGLYINQFVQERWEDCASAATAAEPSKRTADEIVAEQQRTHEFVQFADRTRYVANIDPKKGIKPYPEAAQQQAEPSTGFVSVGDGRIWDGEKWLHIAPGMETYALLDVLRKTAQQRAKPIDSFDFNAIAKTCRGEFDESGGMYFDRKAWGFFVYELQEALSGRRPFLAEKPWDAAAHDVLAERTRQITHEGATPIQDDGHTDSQLALAAATYVLAGLGWEEKEIVGRYWPWDMCWWKPTTPRRNLVKAGALILAEIERLDRAPATQQQAEPKGVRHD